jgi:nitrogen fixation NifU-like protein
VTVGDAALEELYQGIILDHNRRPRNQGTLPHADRVAEGRNPMCGDQLSVAVALDGERIADIAFQAQGCAISRASASMMTQAVKGRSRGEARALAARVRALVTGQPDSGGDDLGQLKALGGVARYPVRVKCASLAWHALTAALDGAAAPVSTE